MHAITHIIPVTMLPLLREETESASLDTTRMFATCGHGGGLHGACWHAWE